MNKNTCAKTPPMGWNSYDYYDTTVNEEQVRANAEYMAKNLKQFGWEYIVIDIQWYAHGAGSMRDKHQYIPFSKLEMDEYSRLIPDPNRFPSSVDGAGFKPLADYIHSLGLKFGIHIMRGIPRIAAHHHDKIMGIETTADEIAIPNSICWWNPDMYGVTDTSEGQAYYDSIFALYAQWGVDFIKCDDICRLDQPSARYETEMLAKAIEKSGRPMVLSLSPGPAQIDWAWHYETYANMWRITDDFWDNWKLLKDMFHRCEVWQNHVYEGCYPDCDMLPLGYLGKGFGEERTTRFTADEQKTMMTMWCLFGSPLMLGCEMTKLDDFTLSLLTNKEVLEMLTPKCVPHQICLDDKKAIWTAYNKETGKAYLALFNLSDETSAVSVSFDQLPFEKAPVSLKELWTKDTVTLNANGVISKALSAHDCVVFGW